MQKKSLLALENGYYDFADCFAGNGTVFGEVVFNTAMTGYEEILTDPSYKGQIINFTYPLIGNYGITVENPQSDKIMAEAVIIRELSNIPSNFNSKMDFATYLENSGIIGIHNLDNRSLTKQIRNSGAVKGGITTEHLDPEKFIEMVRNSPSISDVNVFESVIEKEIREYSGNADNNLVIAAIDFGIKRTIIIDLLRYFSKVILIPFSDDLDNKLKNIDFDGIFLSNGPGDPRIVKNIDFINKFAQNNIPVTGICFGHQLIGKAFELEIDKLPFGHHGGNHPVKYIDNGNVYISSQNHNYAINMDSLKSNNDWDLTWLHLYDNTVSGIKHKTLPICSVQFHPEASPGPNDVNNIVFNDFYNLVKNNATKN
ncbi:MAG: glutamine-hydrolyzing carbamoyl-phosphate synthase small subunit [Candidatus Kapabacteria bacterium]|nr:glutamine-hydrolyzing carbamoyl-phosphate synthase small subunit [Ignavibacteriota bacterium]MCW5883632.1 glutamine-hydrolyzing carbamoyl-phosphate synthase small subunit [Candidatus Kapabacteria bacterium]